MSIAFVLINTVVILFNLLQFVYGCSQDGERCDGVHEICKDNICECITDYKRASNGICTKQNSATDSSTSNTMYIALATLFAVLIVASLVIIAIVLYLYRRKSYQLRDNEAEETSGERYEMSTLKHKPSIRQILGEYNQPKYSHYDNTSMTGEDFDRLAQSLREDAAVFLQMINEVKRKLTLLEDQNGTQALQYKSLIRDISRVLQLLNKDPGNLEMPTDGAPLLLWAEHALKRFEYEELQNPIRDPEIYGECSTANVHDAVL